jgi:hypothetical protein
MRRETPDAERMIKRVRRWVTVAGLHRHEKGQQKAQGGRDHLFGLAIRPFHVVMLSISCYWRKKIGAPAYLGTRDRGQSSGLLRRAHEAHGVHSRHRCHTGRSHAQSPGILLEVSALPAQYILQGQKPCHRYCNGNGHDVPCLPPRSGLSRRESLPAAASLLRPVSGCFDKRSRFRGLGDAVAHPARLLLWRAVDQLL